MASCVLPTPPNPCSACGTTETSRLVRSAASNWASRSRRPVNAGFRCGSTCMGRGTVAALSDGTVGETGNGANTAEPPGEKSLWGTGLMTPELSEPDADSPIDRPEGAAGSPPKRRVRAEQRPRIRSSGYKFLFPVSLTHWWSRSPAPPGALCARRSAYSIGGANPPQASMSRSTARMTASGSRQLGCVVTAGESAISV